MHFRQKLTFMALGSILTLAGYLLATLAGEGTAQSETDKITYFDTIVCRELAVVNAERKPAVIIAATTDGGSLGISSPTKSGPAITLSAASHGGLLAFNNGDMYPAITIGIGEESREGSIVIRSKTRKGALKLHVNEYGGDMSIFGNDNRHRVRLGINERGHGSINVWDKNGFRTFP